MASVLRLGIVGCGRAARNHLGWLRAERGVQIVGCADLDIEAARGLAATVSAEGIPAFGDHKELIRQANPEALAIFTHHLAHYRPALDALQAGLHVFVEKPLSTNVQEAADIVGLARARDRKVGVGHQYRLLPSLREARDRLRGGAIGAIRMASATMAIPWLAAHRGPADTWRLDPRTAGGGILADDGENLLDALPWVVGAPAVEVAAFQSRLDSGLDVVDVAALRLAGGIPATLAISGVAPGSRFEIQVFGESGRIRATDTGLWMAAGDGPEEAVEIPGESGNVDADFVAAVLGNSALCCPADEALETVRLLEAITRSASTGQVVRLA